MNYLDIRRELACQIADRTEPKSDSVLAAHLLSDLVVLPAFEKTCHPHAHQDIVGITAAGRHQPSKFFGAGRSLFRVLRAMALPFHRLESSVANRMDDTSPRQPEFQRSRTLRACRRLPGKDKLGHAGQFGLEQGSGLLPLLFEDLVDG